MRKVFTMGTLLLALTGCTTTPISPGWTPDNENHMRQVIGETVMQALHEHCRMHQAEVLLRKPLNGKL